MFMSFQWHTQRGIEKSPPPKMKKEKEKGWKKKGKGEKRKKEKIKRKDRKRKRKREQNSRKPLKMRKCYKFRAFYIEIFKKFLNKNFEIILKSIQKFY